MKPARWKHIPTDHVADDISRGLPVSDLSGHWLNGPELLKTPKNEWPKEDAKPAPAEADRECKKEKFIGAVAAGAALTESMIKCENYSSWIKLVRVFAWVLKFKKRLLVKIR